MSEQASTHTEIYRPFEGRLRKSPLRFLAITRSHVRVAHKKKRALFFLYVIPAIMAIVYCFIVHLKYSAEAGTVPGLEGAGAALAANAIGKLDLAVSKQITDFIMQTQVFALLAIAWFGSGLIAEDRRLGAHLLYFSRPLTRLDYLLGKVFTAALFGAYATLVPALLVVSVAVFSSPEWSFLKEKWDVILKTFAFCSLVIAVLTSIVLTVSSYASRKTLALASVFGIAMLSEAVGHVLRRLADDDSFLLLSVREIFRRIASWMFDRRVRFDVPLDMCFYVSGGLCALGFILIYRRISRMEVIA